MSARIYQFPANRTARLLRDFSRQTDGVSTDLDSMQEALGKVSSSLKDTRDTLATASKDMLRTVKDFDEHRAIYRDCIEAMDSGSLEEMRKMAALMKKRL